MTALQGARRAPLDRRLRHRLLVARLPQAVPGRLGEGRPLVRRRARHRGRGLGDRRRGREPRARARALSVVAEGVETSGQLARAARRSGATGPRATGSRGPQPPTSSPALLARRSRWVHAAPTPAPADRLAATAPAPRSGAIRFRAVEDDRRSRHRTCCGGRRRSRRSRGPGSGSPRASTSRSASRRCSRSRPTSGPPRSTRPRPRSLYEEWLSTRRRGRRRLRDAEGRGRGDRRQRARARSCSPSAPTAGSGSTRSGGPTSATRRRRSR